MKKVKFYEIIEAVFKDEMIEVRVWQGKNVKRKLN